MKNEKIFVLAHNIRSLYNIGSIFRTADFFSVYKIFLTGYSGTPLNPKLQKVSLGAEKTVPWEFSKSPIRLLKKLKKDYPELAMVGLENNLSKKLGNKKIIINKFQPRFPLLLILGEEVGGIGKNLLPYCNKFLEIPGLGQKESLNVSIAFGIAAYHISLYTLGK